MTTIIPTILLVVCCCLSVGCASITQHEGMFMDTTAGPRRSDMIAPVFSGTVTDAGGIAFGLAAPVVCWFVDDVSGWEFLQAPLCLIDIAPSFVSDLLYLPGDIIHWRRKRKEYCEQTDEPYKK